MFLQKLFDRNKLILALLLFFSQFASGIHYKKLQVNLRLPQDEWNSSSYRRLPAFLLNGAAQTSKATPNFIK